MAPVRFHTVGSRVSRCEGTECLRCHPGITRLLPYEAALDAAHVEAKRRESRQVVAEPSTLSLWQREQRPRSVPMPAVVTRIVLEPALPGQRVRVNDGGRMVSVGVDAGLPEAVGLKRGSNRDPQWGKVWSGAVIATTAVPSHRLIPERHSETARIMCAPQAEASDADHDEGRRVILGRARMAAERARRR